MVHQHPKSITAMPQGHFQSNEIPGLNQKNFHINHQRLLPFLYKTYVRPHLEYYISVWSPYLMRDMDELEKVQHRSTKLVGEISKLPYEDRVQILQLPSLYARRLRGNLIETFKILKGFTNINPDTLFKRSSYSRTRGYNLKLYKKEFRTNICKNFFSNRVINS